MRRTFVILLSVICVLWGASVLHAQDFTPPVVEEPSGQFLDVEWHRYYLPVTVELWNGGLDGSSGLGVYRDDFDGYFEVNLDRQWKPTWPGNTTIIAHSRAIYMNVEAYRVVGPDEGERFLRAVQLGTDFLLAHYLDPDYGGFYWEVDSKGNVIKDYKQDYGNVHPLLALAHAYSVTGDPDYLDAALAHLDLLQTTFLDPDYSGGFLPGFSRDFSATWGVNNVDSFTHYFEALLAMYDVTGGDTQDQIAEMITLEGDFLVNTLYHDQVGYEDRGYVAYNYDTEWQPSQIPYSREMQWSGALHASTGHGVELAYLLSRAVERGFDPGWLLTAEKMLNFALIYSPDPQYGGMRYDTTDYEGQPLAGNPDNSQFTWWAQGETARALLHFIVVRGRDDFVEPFLTIQALINDHLTDHEYGGWYHGLDAEKDLRPIGMEKGDVWKVNYHFSMYYTEVLRLADQYADRVQALNEQYPG